MYFFLYLKYTACSFQKDVKLGILSTNGLLSTFTFIPPYARYEDQETYV